MPPTPPNKLVPPITTAAIHLKVQVGTNRWVGCCKLTGEKKTGKGAQETGDHKCADRHRTHIDSIQAVPHPRCRRTLYTLRPKTVYRRTRPATMETAIAMMNWYEKMPMPFCPMSSRKPFEIDSGAPPVNTRASPKPAVIRP